MTLKDYTKVNVDPQETKLELGAPLHFQEEIETSVAKYGHQDLTKIKTIYGLQQYSWAVPKEEVVIPEIDPTDYDYDYDEMPDEEELYFQALNNIKCDFGFACKMFAYVTKSGEFIDLSQAPLFIEVETPTNTMEKLPEFKSEQEFVNFLKELKQ